jgi:hypothetical protein
MVILILAWTCDDSCCAGNETAQNGEDDWDQEREPNGSSILEVEERHDSSTHMKHSERQQAPVPDRSPHFCKEYQS